MTLLFGSVKSPKHCKASGEPLLPNAEGMAQDWGFAQHARWAKKSGASQAPAAEPVKKKRGLSPEGRARIVAALKARWAKKRVGMK